MIIWTLKVFGAVSFGFGALLFLLGGLAALENEPAVVALPWGFILMLMGGPLHALGRIVEALEQIARNTRRPLRERAFQKDE